MTDKSTKNILLTGASGFLGQHVLHELLTRPNLLEDGPWHVYALYGSKQGFPEAVKQVTKTAACTVTIESLDLTDDAAVKAWLAKHPPMHVCIHSAAISSPRVCQEDPDKATAMNVPKVLFDELCAQKCRIIALSTDQVYGGDQSASYKESDETQPVNVYGRSKLEMEQYLQQITNGQAVLLRSSIILGKLAPIAKAHDTFVHFCATRERTPTDFYTDEYRNVVFVEDVVETILFFIQRCCCGDQAVGGIYNMGGPTKVSRVDMAAAVKTTTLLLLLLLFLRLRQVVLTW